MIPRPNTALSQIHLQIMWSRLIAVVEEQAQTLMRTAFSTTVREAGDLSAGVFDRDGNYVTGNQKLLEMRLRDETIRQRANTGFSIRSAFDVKPGAYSIRLVVRDAEGQQMSAENGAVEIP